MTIKEISEKFEVDIFDASDLYYTTGGSQVDDKSKAMGILRRCYMRAQLPYELLKEVDVKMETAIETGKDLDGTIDGPDQYYITKSLHTFLKYSDDAGVRSYSDMVCAIVYVLLEHGETFKTILCMTDGLLNKFGWDITAREFRDAYVSILKQNEEYSLDVFRESYTRDASVCDLVAKWYKEDGPLVKFEKDKKLSETNWKDVNKESDRQTDVVDAKKETKTHKNVWIVLGVASTVMLFSLMMFFMTISRGWWGTCFLFVLAFCLSASSMWECFIEDLSRPTRLLVYTLSSVASAGLGIVWCVIMYTSVF